MLYIYTIQWYSVILPVYMGDSNQKRNRMTQQGKVQVAEVSLQDLLVVIEATQTSSSSTEGSTLRRIREHLQLGGKKITLGSIASARTEAEALGLVIRQGYRHELTSSGISKLDELRLRQKIPA